MNNSFVVESRLDAKQRLIKAGLEIFGTSNLEGATTRQLAERAGVNQAAIPYYFKTLFGVYLQVLLDDKAATTWARIIMREQMQPTKAFHLLYERWIRRVHETLAALLAVILKKRPTDPNVILRTHILVGQIQIFLSGRERFGAA